METTKGFDGQALYQPKGKAKEYSEWAVNYFVGCSNKCDYCYLKKGIGKKVLGGDTPTLKKCFSTETWALQTYLKELDKNMEEIGDKGVFLSFTTDPMLPETRNLTFATIEETVAAGIPVQVLTKRVDWLSQLWERDAITKLYTENRKKIAFGFTLTGHDEHEPFASPNANRIAAMKQLHDAGFKTFASVEPVINPQRARLVIGAARICCDLFKVGLMSGKKDYRPEELERLINDLKEIGSDADSPRVYLKESIVKFMGIKRKSLPKHFVNADYNIFTDK